MTWLKENKIKLLMSLIILGFIGGWFFWFQWRPTQIRKKCVNITREKVKGNSDISTTGINLIYNFCLRENGIER